MRLTSSVTSVSWIPVGAIEGLNRVAFDLGIAHYDQPLVPRGATRRGATRSPRRS